jgi:hypothetical protein
MDSMGATTMHVSRANLAPLASICFEYPLSSLWRFTARLQQIQNSRLTLRPLSHLEILASSSSEQ